MFYTYIVYPNGNTEINTDNEVWPANKVIDYAFSMQKKGWQFKARCDNHFVFQHHESKAVLTAFYEER